MQNSFNIQNCLAKGCEKARTLGVNYGNHIININKCSAYANPAVLVWHRHGEECPAGPYQSNDVKILREQKLNPIKASKRASR